MIGAGTLGRPAGLGHHETMHCPSSSCVMFKPLLGALAAGLVLVGCAGSPSTTSGVAKSLDQTTPTRQTVASTALAQVGDAYAAHMAGPQQFDDTGLAYYAYRQNGRTLPRALDDQLNAGQPIALDAAQPGDLVFFRLDSPDGAGRLSVGVLASPSVAVIALPGARNAGGGVRRVSLAGEYWQDRFVGVTRILPDDGR